MTNEVQLQQLESIIAEVVAPNALKTDCEGLFPSASMEALASGGFLGVLSAKEVGGGAQGLAGAAAVVRRLAASCGSTAMVTCMHYCATAVYEAMGTTEIRKAIAAGKHLSTLAFSEAGSRSHFWAPVSTATAEGDQVRLNAHKSWITTAHHADSYVWSSQAMKGEGLSLWHVPRESAGLELGKSFDGLGFRGNDSVPALAKELMVPASSLLGEDGSGFASMMQVVLPHFCVLIAAGSLGLMDSSIAQATAHLSETRYAHQDSRLCDFPTLRAYLAKSQIRLDCCSALWHQTIEAIESGDEMAMLRVMECKAAAAEAAIEVTDTCMRICGGAAFRKELGIERAFRDARAAAVMGPTSDVLFDFIGKSLCGVPLF